MTAMLRLLRLCRPTPNGVLLALPIAEGLLFAADRFDWFAFNRLKGCTALVTCAVAAGTLSLLLAWFLLSLMLRRGFQLHLRSLLLLVASVAIPCAWLTSAIDAARREEAAVERLSHAGVHSDFGDDPFADFAARDSDVWPPKWLEPRFSKCFFRDIVALYVHLDEHESGWTRIGYAVEPHLDVDDGVLESLVEFAALERLDLGHSAATDAGLARSIRHPQLESLRLDGTTVTDDGLRVIADQLPRLRRLSVGNTGVTDTFLLRFAGVSRLTQLNLSGSAVRDRGVRALESARGLVRLDLSGTAVTDAGLEAIAGLRLEKLSLARTNITDAGLKHLTSQSALESLDLSGTQITDAGLQRLVARISIRDLNLADTTIADAGLEALWQMDLRKLNLAGTQVTGSGLSFLRARELSELNLSRSKLIDRWAKEFGRLQNLSELDLSETAITDEFAVELDKLVRLRELRLAQTSVTAAGLVGVTKSPLLRELDLCGTAVSAVGLAALSPSPVALPSDQLHVIYAEGQFTPEERDSLKTLYFLERFDPDDPWSRIGGEIGWTFP